MDTGTIKSIERQRGTGSIAPDRGARINADVGFTSAVVGAALFSTLAVGDRVRFEAVQDAQRPGHATATSVEVDVDTSGLTGALRAPDGP